MRPGRCTSKQLYREPDFETLHLLAGQERDPVKNFRAVPIHQNTATHSTASGYLARRQHRRIELCDFTRMCMWLEADVQRPGKQDLSTRVWVTRPSCVGLSSQRVDIVRKRMVTLEGGVATVTASRLYGGTYQQFKVVPAPMKKYGIDVIFVESLDPVEPHINDKTKTISVGTLAAVGLPSHPLHQQALRMLRPNAVGGVLTFCVRQGG
ncbi:hypothetical protein B0H16DRAFT_1734157 [Mycena metata]|uniref:Uncharacterized protein n=1 Tax=Mycena metata TaxID=1033252 RepID=A0AAD7MRA9_9AGAR|nr:hypothetical protein B0H16DRAFT_1734157 [Mycena metata]